MRSEGVVALLLAALTLPAAPSRTLSKTSGVVRAVGIPAGANHRHVRVRASFDGVLWSPWREVITDPENGTLIWLDSPARLVEVEGAGDERLLLIDRGVTPRQAATDTDPLVQGREKWCPAPFVCPKASSPSSTTPTHLIVHHTASANSATDYAALMRAFWELHVKGNGWADIGYNFLIDPAGTAWEGRGDGILGAHFSGVNTATSGISLIGTYTNIPPASAALDKLVELLTWQARRYQLDPVAQTTHAASGLELNVISGHRDAGLSPKASGATECPGVALYPLLPTLRDAVCRNIPGCPSQADRADTCATAAAPCISRYGIVNSASFDARPVAPGSIASAFGANLENLRATVNSRPAPIVGASPYQLNVLIPTATEPGTARLQLFDGTTLKTERLFWATEAAPAIYAVLNHDDQTLNSPAAPAAPGRPLTLYLAGAQSGIPWSTTIGNIPAGKLYLGPAPGIPGLWQSNITVPASLTPGVHDLVLSVSGVTSAPLPIHINNISQVN